MPNFSRPRFKNAKRTSQTCWPSSKIPESKFSCFSIVYSLRKSKIAKVGSIRRLDRRICIPRESNRSRDVTHRSYLLFRSLFVKFERNSFKRSLTMNCRSIPIMDVRIRTSDRWIANLMIKVSLTDRQLSSCEISSKSDGPFSLKSKIAKVRSIRRLDRRICVPRVSSRSRNVTHRYYLLFCCFL